MNCPNCASTEVDQITTSEKRIVCGCRKCMCSFRLNGEIIYNPNPRDTLLENIVSNDIHRAGAQKVMRS